MTRLLFFLAGFGAALVSAGCSCVLPFGPTRTTLKVGSRDHKPAQTLISRLVSSKRTHSIRPNGATPLPSDQLACKVQQESPVGVSHPAQCLPHAQQEPRFASGGAG